MIVREPSVAGMFYPADAATCQRQLAAYLRQDPVSLEGASLFGGLVPHAGWVYSGATAAHLFAAMPKAPETVVLLGAIHRWGVSSPSAYPDGAWRTPLGDCLVDDELAQAMQDAPHSTIVASRQAHAGEHSIEVQVPFVQYAFPEARIVPVAVPPDRQAISAGRDIAQAIRALGRRALIVASSDLSHYGPRYGMAPAGVGKEALAWAKANDRRLLDRVLTLNAPQVLGIAAKEHSACGSGAIAAAIAATAEMGATRGVLLHHTTSYEVMPRGRPTDFVGYAAVAFVA